MWRLWGAWELCMLFSWCSKTSPACFWPQSSLNSLVVSSSIMSGLRDTYSLGLDNELVSSPCWIQSCALSETMLEYLGDGIMSLRGFLKPGPYPSSDTPVQIPYPGERFSIFFVWLTRSVVRWDLLRHFHCGEAAIDSFTSIPSA